MDMNRFDRGVRESSESPPPPPSPPAYAGSNVSSVENPSKTGKLSSRRSPTSPSSPPSNEKHRRKRRSGSRSSSTRSHKRSRSRDRDKERERDKERSSRKHSRRDRSRSRSRGRSRSKERRRSRSRNKSRDRHRYREGRRYHRQASYESDIAHEEVAESGRNSSQSFMSAQPNAFKNDGSFMEMFKKMQEQMPNPSLQNNASSATAAASSSTGVVLQERTAPPPPLMVGKRRGGRILKTGMVAKPKTEPTADQPKDAWSLYMAEQSYGRIMPGAITADQLKTAPFDPRFPNQNQTRYCYQSYVDFHRCQRARGQDYEPCQYFKKVFTSICPVSWVDKWDEQLEEGRFPGNL